MIIDKNQYKLKKTVFVVFCEAFILEFSPIKNMKKYKNKKFENS